MLYLTPLLLLALLLTPTSAGLFGKSKEKKEFNLKEILGEGVNIKESRKSKIKKQYNIEINIKKCCDISEASRKRLKISKENFTKNYIDITKSKEIDIVIELIGGIKVAYNISKETLKNKKHLVTANKALLAYKGKDLRKLSNVNNVSTPSP